MPASILRSLYLRDRVNIEQYPELSETHVFNKDAQITIGDLHGNALKLIYFLLKHRVIRISREDYLQFVRLYNKDVTQTTPEDLNWFRGMVNRIRVSDQKGTVRLIGDDLSDRGTNDYFTLKILKKLFNDGINLEVILSNHVGEFIEAHENRQNYMPVGLQFRQARSMGNMELWIQRGLITRDEIKNIVNQEYLPHLKLLSYTIDSATNRISIFTHAPCGLETIRGLARKLNVPYRDNTIQNLARTIEAINRKFSRDYANRGRVHELFEADWDQDNIDPIRQPFAHLMWNRNYDHLERPIDHHAYHLKFIHGHDSIGANIRGRFYNLDNDLGKEDNREGLYNVHYTHEKPLSRRLAMALNEQANQATPKGLLYSSNLTKSLISATALTGITYFAYGMITATTLMMGAAAVLAVTGLLMLRNYLYIRKADEIIPQQAHRQRGAAAQEVQRVFGLGQGASNSWTAWAKSFADLSAWYNARTFGAGMMRPDVVAQPETGVRRRRARAH